MAYLVDICVRFILLRRRVLHHGEAVPLVALGVQVDEDVVVRVHRAPGAFALVDDDGHRRLGGGVVLHDGHISLERVLAVELHVLVVPQDVGELAADRLEAFKASRQWE